MAILAVVATADREEDSLDGLELAHEVVDALVDHRAADVALLDLTSLTSLADFFVIATAESERQMRALVDAIDQAADVRSGIHPRWEGRSGDGWQLADLGGIVVHLFSVESRTYYDLEGLWRRAQEIVHIQ